MPNPAGSASSNLERRPKEIAPGLAPEQGAPASASMPGVIMQHVAALAARCEVGVLVVSRVVAAVRRGERDPRNPGPGEQVFVA